MKIIAVTAAIIEHNGLVLLAQRKENTSQALKWEFPGGKIEFKETPEECVIREIREELHAEIEIKELFGVASHVYDETQVILICYRCFYISGEIRTDDCLAFRWVHPEELLSYDLAHADIPLAEKYVQCVSRTG